MRRNALRELLRGLALSTLPLAAGCATRLPPGDTGDPAVQGEPDASCEPPDLVYSSYLVEPFTCPGGGFLTIEGPLPIDNASCLALCPRCTSALPFGQCQSLEICGYHGISCRWGAAGRRPAGLAACAPAAAEAGVVAAAVARMAFLEAASVPAFVTLARELSSHGAPARLIDGARRAAADEVRHARVMTGLARRFGAEPARPVVREGAVRALDEIALENAVEGCAREGFGALLATWQSLAAGDPGVRAAMEVIAEDETRHASLAWAVARWIEPLLARDEQDRVNAARDDEMRELVLRADAEPPAELVRDLGLPAAAAARTLARGFAGGIAKAANAAA